MRAVCLLTGLAIATVGVSFPGAAAASNPYGVHTFIQDAMSDSMINTHLDWAASLTGPGGWVKQLMYPVGPSVITINPQWVKFINGCYARGLIPVIRLGTWMEGGSWVKPTPDSPGNYHSWATALKNIVAQMPRSGDTPLYIEVLNECNNNMEWSGAADPIEYARFFVQTSNAIRSLADSRIRILNCGLSPGGSYNNVAYVEACCGVPGFINAFDVWAFHTYPGVPPEINIHDGTAPMGAHTIDSYLAELEVLANHGRTGVQVIATETAYSLGPDGEDARADRVMRAFRDYWSRWPEVLGICPYEFCDPHGGNDGLDWVNRMSGTTPQNLPTIAHEQYWSVYKLAKPGHATGCISGKVTESVFGAPLSGAQVTLTPGSAATTTDGAGNYFFPRLTPGTYSVSVTRANYSFASASGIEVRAAENEVRDFSLTPTVGCSISGVVRDSLGGQPIENARVALSPGGYAAYTDAEGRYQFLDITPSTYTVQGSSQSYYSYASREITLHAGESTAWDFYLGPGAPPGGTNLIGGTDFEEPPGTGAAYGWTPEAGYGNHYCVDSSVRYTGRRSQRINPSDPSNDMVWNITDYSAITSGQRYRIEVWCRTGSGLAGAAKLIGRWYSNDMVYAGSFDGAPQLTAPDGWTLLVARGVAPSFTSSSNRGRLQVELRAETTAGSVWFDQAWAGLDPQTEEPLPSITGLVVTPESGRTRFDWRNSVGSGCTGVRVVYRTDRYPMHAADGTLAADVAGPPGAYLSFTHTGLTLGQRYYYAFFAHASGRNLSRPRFATAVGADLTPPTTPVVTDEGEYTFSPDTLSAWWTSSDPESGIGNYRYCIGTVPNGLDVVGWTDVGTVSSVTRTGLNLAPGKRYYFRVVAQNGVGLWSAPGVSDGIYCVRDCVSTAEAKSLPDGAMVRVSGVVAAGGAFAGAAYLQDLDRAGGIRLAGDVAGLVEGNSMSVIGTLGTLGGERVLTLRD